MGPLEALQTLARKVRVDVAFIGETLDPVSPKPVGMELLSPSAWQSVLPTHTYANPPDDLEVLFVPGKRGGWEYTDHFRQACSPVRPCNKCLRVMIRRCICRHR